MQNNHYPKGKLTPLMRQYWQIKSQHQDKILFFRMGDFFEMFHEDAQKAAPVLNIALTMRNKKADDETKMCGVPHHSIAGPISKLLTAGFKVAICDQVEPSSQAKGLVKREVTRILTPGMVYDPESLDQLSANYLCAFDEDSVSFLDSSTGEAFFYSIDKDHEKEDIIRLLHPVEMVLSLKQKEKAFLKKEWEGRHLTVFEKEFLTGWNKPLSVRRLLSYVREGQGENALKIIQPFQQKWIDKEMRFSRQAQEHLELFKRDTGDKKGSLFSAINRTRTPAGARLLKARLRAPSTDENTIQDRLNAVEKWLNEPDKTDRVRELLSEVGDIERKIGKISHPHCGGRDLLNLAESLKKSQCLLTEGAIGTTPSFDTQSLADLAQEIAGTIRLDAPAGTQNGLMIQKGVFKELDSLMEETERKQKALRRMEDQERSATGIPSLKIRYNNVFGYYIEITKTHSHKVPSAYIRKQTLTQAERYTTEKLQTIEGLILSVRARRIELELKIFENLRQKILNFLPDLFCLSRAVCEMDLQTALSHLAMEQSYTRPRFASDGQLVLAHSRHPVVEQKQKSYFVPNTIRLKKGECLLLTGPNMAGKSTLMRQVALSAILAQAGSFVPAEQALLPIFNQLFTRIGASDSLSEGLSTFMVEMKESVEILKKADERSLVILDEIGRGTATYDGMSLAQAIVEHLVQNNKSLVFFATHYHELTSLSQILPQVRNAHLSVREKEEKIDFLYTLTPGALAQSYGVHVARLAGFPLSVIQRAKELLQEREKGAQSVGTVPNSSPLPHAHQPKRTAPDSSLLESLVKDIKSWPLTEKSPLETLSAVALWKKTITENKHR